MSADAKAAGFTLMELLVALALMALVVPVVVKALHVATLAGEVSQRKALAVRIADRVINERIMNGQTQSATSGDEKAGDYQFHWNLEDQPWDQLNGMAVSTSPNGVNQSVVNPSLIHQLSVDVTFLAQGKSFGVHVSTLVNNTQP